MLLQVDDEAARNWYRLLQSQNKDIVKNEMMKLTAPLKQDKLEFIKVASLAMKTTILWDKQPFIPVFVSGNSSYANVCL